jgi:hypothetical protein
MSVVADIDIREGCYNIIAVETIRAVGKEAGGEVWGGGEVYRE